MFQNHLFIVLVFCVSFISSPFQYTDTALALAAAASLPDADTALATSALATLVELRREELERVAAANKVCAFA